MLLDDSFQIRIATSDDRNSIIHLLKQLAQWMKDNEINQWQFLLAGGDDAEIAQAIENNETYVVMKDNDLAATFTVSTIQSDWDRELWGEDNSSNSLYLHRLGIDLNYMKIGVGRAILSWIESNFQGEVEYVKLDCVADNMKLNHFYKNNGFELVGVTDGFNKYQKKLDP
ncbi:GNAT family N-acetyltransferase [Neobacillus kokaensis]|uniref:N-acetyltransferase n=1 Tax=Neobacillus kokaensis TaxID=2759023 RepID=A0ABQ3N9E0_9BACI|nr:GNAT family N-acetyltransferase [Neobacillus kokaensis]GHH99310.1 N-acetyltransferase [Neobacillus kokaensis]